MDCIDKTELEQFLRGGLGPDRMLAVDEHCASCASCRETLASLPIRMKATADLGMAMLGLTDCPDYEELSAYVGNSLSAERTAAIVAHINMCECCAADIERIGELRSQAALRETITVMPGMSGRRPRSPFGLWKNILAGVSVTAGVAAVALVLWHPVTPPKPSSTVTVTHGGPTTTVKTTPQVPTPVPPHPSNTTSVANKPEKAPTAPSYTTVLSDGGYRVIRKGRRLEMASSNGQPITRLEAQIAASIAEKLSTGRIRPAKPVQMAMATIRLRSGEDFIPPPTAPKPISPAARIVESNRPAFTWSKVDLAQEYRLVVTDKDGNVVLDAVTDKNAFTPDKSLQQGRVYVWRVGVSFGESDSWANSSAVKFKVLSADDRNSIERVKRHLPGSHLALGAVYESVGLYQEAANQYRLLRRENPRSNLARQLLMGAVESAR